ncbi:hypothetical protein [Streptosporangium sp. NBC_01469]|uniref:hypothetical protein n=1 Tax=Streptosporangium sp. NBC_01469 TaxID=2903898 RepID=UPI002E291418|nr:hypothetical protein [Streptosporangium sp. NBC_01469]
MTRSFDPSPVKTLTRLGAGIGELEETTFEELRERTTGYVGSDDRMRIGHGGAPGTITENSVRFHTTTSITQAPYLFKYHKKIYLLLKAYIWPYLLDENKQNSAFSS